MMTVDVASDSTLRAGTPRELFAGRYETAPDVNYDVAPDGQRFVMVRSVNEDRPLTNVNIVLDWSEQLKRLAPTK
jgi:hypothetical protein